MNKKVEIRTFGEAPVAGEGRTISGYAIVFDVESRVLASWDGDFVEIIERGAVDEALIAQSDVRFEFEAPNTSHGNDVLELVKRGDLQGCSFAFTADEENIKYSREGDRRLRRVRKLSGLYDVSVVVDPAYTQTSVDARSFPEPVPAPVTGRSLAECQEIINKMRVC